MSKAEKARKLLGPTQGCYWLTCSTVLGRIELWHPEPVAAGATGALRSGSGCAAQLESWFQCSVLPVSIARSALVTAVGFEPTPLRTGAWSQRLRPLGQTVLKIDARQQHLRRLL